MNKGGCKTGRVKESPDGGCKIGKKNAGAKKYRVIKQAKARQAKQEPEKKKIKFRVVREAGWRRGHAGVGDYPPVYRVKRNAKVPLTGKMVREHVERQDAEVADFLGGIEDRGFVFNKKRIETDNAINSAAIPARQIGVLPQDANQMDFFALMNLLPGDIKKNIGGLVKGDRQMTGAQFIEAGLGDEDFYELTEDFSSNYMDSMNYMNDYSDFLTDREERFYKMALEKADYSYYDIQNVLTEKQFGKFEDIEAKLMEGISEKEIEYHEELNNKFLTIQGGTMFATEADALKAYIEFLNQNY